MQDITCFQSFLSCNEPILPQKCQQINRKMIIPENFDKKTTGENALDSLRRT
jgi:hypothetical protein